MSRDDQWKWLRRNGISTYKEKMIIDFISDYKWRKNYVLARPWKSFLWF